jgi:riboflavin synthase
VGGWVCYKLIIEKNCSGVSRLGWLGTLQIGIISYGSNIGLLRARIGANREDSLSKILYICVNLGENGGNV